MILLRMSINSKRIVLVAFLKITLARETRTARLNIIFQGIYYKGVYKMKNKKALAMAVWAAVASIGFVMTASAAEETMSTEVAPVVVEGQQDVLPGGLLVATDRVGVLGDMKAIEVPFTERQYSQKTIEMFENPNQPMNGVLANNPSIVITSHNPLTTDFAMRGINMNGTQYSINNVPSMFSQYMTIPTHVMESIDITSGPNTVLNGATNCQNGANNDGRGAAGRLNATTKKATDKDINRYVQKFSGRGTWTEGLEVGRRMGKNNEWGVLVNARQDKGKLSMQGGRIEDKSIYVNVDRKGEHAKTNLFGGYFDKNVEGAQRWLNGQFVTKLPTTPDLKKSISFDDQFKNVRGYLMTLNHDQKFSDKWSAFANMGFGYNKQHYNDFNAATVYFNNDGSLYYNAGNSNNKFRDFYSESYTRYMQIGATDTTEIKDGKNQLTIAYDYMNYHNKSNSANGDWFKGSILTGIINNGTSADAWTKYKNKAWDKETVNSVTIADKLEYKKSSLFVSAQYRDGDYAQVGYKAIGSNTWNPTYAYAYKPEENISLYASYATSFTRARVVAGSGTTHYNNEGEVFEPIKNKQTEIGVKYENGGVMHSLAFFDIKEASYIAETVAAGPYNQIYTQEGQNDYKGIEYYATGKIASKWNLMGGMMYMNAKREKMAKGSEKYEGSRTTGAPRWNFTMAAEYEMDKNNSVYGRINSCTDSVLNNNGVKTPGYTTVDLGYTHKFKLGASDVKLNATCYNVLGKDYWLARGSTNSMTLGAPRTFMVSATFDF